MFLSANTQKTAVFECSDFRMATYCLQLQVIRLSNYWYNLIKIWSLQIQFFYHKIILMV
jgi:hypothetical protein